MIKRIIIIVVLIFLTSLRIANAESLDDVIKMQEDSLGITDFIQESNKYTEDLLSDIDMQDLFKDALKGKIDNRAISKCFFQIFGKEIKNTITIFASIILIIVINSILNCITEGLENKSISQIAFFVQYILIVTIILTNFSSIIDSIRETVNNMTDFCNMLIPIMMTLIISMGNVTTASIIEPIIIFMISLISNFINNVAIPIVLISTSLGIISKLSDKVQIDRLAKRLKSSSLWFIALIMTVFVTVVSVNGNLTGRVDAVASKTAKTAVSNLIPFVGKILGDAMDSVLSCGSLLKGALGTLGTIVIIAISITPIIKLLLMMGIYYLGAAVCEPIADKKIVSLLDHMGDTFKILLAILCSMSIMIIIGLTLTIKISNINGVG
ncbi:MAG: stage III sporulation protein AE [Clostridia bacterium]|nr:stage III sporulation protein AE [Clostridia bacterium]